MSDEVSQFLEQVERLRGQQIEEDEVRARELEEYLAAKRERQARREGERGPRKLCAMLRCDGMGWERDVMLDFCCCIDGVHFRQANIPRRTQHNVPVFTFRPHCYLPVLLHDLFACCFF